MFSTCLENFLPFSSNLKLSSANSFSLEASNINFVGWERVHYNEGEPFQFLTLSQMTNFRLPNWKNFADDNFEFHEIGGKFSNR